MYKNYSAFPNSKRTLRYAKRLSYVSFASSTRLDHINHGDLSRFTGVSDLKFIWIFTGEGVNFTTYCINKTIKPQDKHP